MAETPLPAIAEGTVDPAAMNRSMSTNLALDRTKKFREALKADDLTALESCFYAEQAYWKDQLALTYHLRTFQQAGAIAASLIETKKLRGVDNMELDGEANFVSVSPTLQFIDCNFTFKTKSPGAACHGKLLLLPSKTKGGIVGAVSWKIWVLSTRLGNYDFHPEDVYLLQGPAKPLSGLKTFETDVLIIGGGNSSVKITSTTYNQATKLWKVVFLTPMGQRTVIAKHVVQATGIGSQKPYLPPIADPHLYKGVSVHSTAYRNAKDLRMLGAKVWPKTAPSSDDYDREADYNALPAVRPGDRLSEHSI
ncbi:flavin-containing monooxygenase protein [Colletotrichum tofieldiae]|nr:flavin-containing monooxygenase protein [Colletotrichum tofieldiae]GKT82106.1 flavin-containing monooxygenase protein [Colletotrichum tofieldiae]